MQRRKRKLILPKSSKDIELKLLHRQPDTLMKSGLRPKREVLLPVYKTPKQAYFDAIQHAPAINNGNIPRNIPNSRVVASAIGGVGGLLGAICAGLSLTFLLMLFAGAAKPDLQSILIVIAMVAVSIIAPLGALENVRKTANILRQGIISYALITDVEETVESTGRSGSSKTTYCISYSYYIVGQGMQYVIEPRAEFRHNIRAITDDPFELILVPQDGSSNIVFADSIAGNFSIDQSGIISYPRGNLRTNVLLFSILSGTPLALGAMALLFKYLT